MHPDPPQRLQHPDVATDLKAVVAARSELDDDMEDHLIGAFLDRIEQRIDSRIDQRLTERAPSRPAKSSGQHREMVLGSMGISIPLLAIGGGIAGEAGIFAVMGAVAVINACYFLYEFLTEGHRNWR